MVDVRTENELLERLRTGGDRMTVTTWFDDEGDVAAVLLLVDDPAFAEVLVDWYEAPDEVDAEGEGVVDHDNGTSGRNRRNRTCKRCGFGPTTAAGLAAHQRSTGHKGSAPA